MRITDGTQVEHTSEKVVVEAQKLTVDVEVLQAAVEGMAEAVNELRNKVLATGENLDARISAVDLRVRACEDAAQGSLFQAETAADRAAERAGNAVERVQTLSGEFNRFRKDTKTKLESLSDAVRALNSSWIPTLKGSISDVSAVTKDHETRIAKLETE